MTDTLQHPAIIINNLSKSYKLYKSKKHRIFELLHPFRKKFHTRFNALSEVSFEVQKGDIVGIIGQNGSGKSTLLKILSEVAYPTSGSFVINGKVAALLELGGGFNVELSGLENIYYIGALQGFSRKEMKSRIKSIVDFADIGEYIYQPVSTYSSGMYIRLAFAMTINLDSEILIADEALSVGDVRFQQKCYRHIRELKESGKTILICTHSLGIVRDFCTKVIWLEKGVIKAQGDPVIVTNQYSAFMTTRLSEVQHNHHSDVDLEQLPVAVADRIKALKLHWNNLSECENYGSYSVEILTGSLVDVNNNSILSTSNGDEKLNIFVLIRANVLVQNPEIQIVINGSYGNPVVNIQSTQYLKKYYFGSGQYYIENIEFRLPNLVNGKYSISVGVLSYDTQPPSILHWIHDAFLFTVLNPDARFKTNSQIVLDAVDFQSF